MPYFEKIEGFSAYFHQIDLQSLTITAEYGKVGGVHKQSSKTFPTAQKAQIAYEKLLNEKQAKGYREPNNEAIPDERIDWTPKLMASLPIIRGIHTPPLELVLKPLTVSLNAEENNDYEYDLQMFNSVISPFQTLIKNKLDNPEQITNSSLARTIWTDHIDKLLDLTSKNKGWTGHAYATRRNTEAILNLFSQSIEAGLILLGTVAASEIFIERLCLYSLSHYDYFFRSTRMAIPMLRHQIALLPDVEYEYLLGVASRHFRQSICHVDMILTALFPTQQTWIESLIDNELQGNFLHVPSRKYAAGGTDILHLFPSICSLQHFQKLYTGGACQYLMRPDEATLWLHFHGIDSVVLFDHCIEKLTNSPGGWGLPLKLKNLLSTFTHLHTEAAVDVLIKHKRNKIVSELLFIQSRRWPDFIRKKLQR